MLYKISIIANLRIVDLLLLVGWHGGGRICAHTRVVVTLLLTITLQLSKKLIWIVGNDAVDAALGKLLQGAWAIDRIDVGKEIRPTCNLYR